MSSTAVGMTWASVAAIPATSVSLNLTLSRPIQHSTKDQPKCRACLHHTQPQLSSGTLQPHHTPQGLVGLIVRLPSKDTIPAASIAHFQLEDHAYAHPCIIVALSPCGHLAKLLPCTSMNGRSLEQKYSRICRDDVRDEVFREFVALEREGTKAHNEYLPLAHSGRFMPHQSYVRLSRSYWIEVGCLDLFPGRPRYLDPKTLRRLMEYHEGVQRTGIWSTSARSRSSSPRKESQVVPPRQEGGAKVSNKRRDSAVDAPPSPPPPPLLADPAAEQPSPNHESSVVQSDRQPKPQAPEPCRGKCLYSCIVRAPAVIPSEAPSPRLLSPKTLEHMMSALQRLEFFLEQRYGAF
ncbi:hypothetical protein KC315_g13614 [Hortaea werneckii]|nr:hypothetical protein KC315_g13614 [Hortaea werneckii]KAI7367560.1 hypothetical protein KC354_g3353 [Hortaea werneckii]